MGTQWAGMGRDLMQFEVQYNRQHVAEELTPSVAIAKNRKHVLRNFKFKFNSDRFFVNR